MGLLASRQFHACLMYLPASQGKAVASSPSDAQSPQSAAAGETPTPNPKMLTKAERKRKQFERATEAARADERGQWQGKRAPDSAGARRSCAAIPRLLLEMGCVSRTPASCTAADSNDNTCFPYNFPEGCPNALLGLHVFRQLLPAALCKHQSLSSWAETPWTGAPQDAYTIRCTRSRTDLGKSIKGPSSKGHASHFEASSASSCGVTGSKIVKFEAISVQKRSKVCSAGLAGCQRPTIFKVCCVAAGLASKLSEHHF